MKGRTPTREERAWMDAITQVGCIVCRAHLDTLSPAEVHHIEGKTVPGAHFRTIPLCYHHHRGGHDNDQCSSRHPYKARFVARYGTEDELWDRTREFVQMLEAGDGIATV